jgi:YidC/Oxa1 family membrane protein insertase
MALLPTLIKGQKHNLRMTAITPQMNAMRASMTEAKTQGDQVAMQVHGQAVRNLLRENDVNPLKLLKPLFIQMPLIFCSFTAIRRLADTPLPQLIEGGVGWVTDLTAPDPLWILPISSIVFQNLVLRVSRF